MRKVLSLGIALCFALSLFSGTLAPVPTARAAVRQVPGDYATIQAAINAASPGDTISVAAGTYAGNITVNKSVTIVGNAGDATPGPGANAPVIDGGSAPGDAFKIANGVSNVTIKGFEMRNFTSNDTGIGNGISAWVGSTSYISIEDNWFHNLGYNGVLVGNDKSATPSKWGDHSYWTIKNNVLETFEVYGFELTNTSHSSIENNIIHSNATWNLAATCIMVDARRNAHAIVIRGNQIDGQMWPGYPAVFVFANSFETPNVSLDDVLIEDNMISTTGTVAQVRVRNYSGTGTVTGVHMHGNSLSSFRNSTSAPVDATGNWWGTAVKSTIQTRITSSALVTFEPYWIDEGMTIASDAVLLTVTVTGSGSVAKSPDQAAYTYGTSVQLTATPIVGWHFEGWSGGDLTGTTNPAALVMDWNKSVAAAFAINRYTITVSAGTNGRVTPGTGTFDYHTTHAYAVQPDPGYLIDTLTVDGVAVKDAGGKLGWTVTLADVDANHTIAATFKLVPDVLAPIISFPDFSTMAGITGWSGGAVPRFTVSVFPFPLPFTLDDDRGGLLKWTIKVNGIVIIDPAGRGLVTYLIPLAEGRNDVEVTAQDNAGNMASRKLVIYLDTTAPALSVGALPASVATPVLPITGSVVDAVSGLRSLTINGEAAIPYLDGFFHERLTLTRGVNSIVVEARDNAGNATSQTFTVMYGASTTVSPSIYVVLTIGSTDLEVNGLVRKLDAAPFIKDGRTLLPIRALIESLGGTVSWNTATRTATVSLGSRTVALTIGSKTALVDGKRITMDVAPAIVSGRTFLPLRAVAENVGLDLAWEPISQTVSLTWWP